MSRLDLLLVLPMMDADADCFWMADDAASAVGAISSGGGTEVRCFFFGCCWTSSCSSSSLLLEEVELASESSVMVSVMIGGFGRCVVLLAYFGFWLFSVEERGPDELGMEDSV